MGVLLAACPSFAPKWQTFLEEWRDHPEELHLYLTLSDFARHLVGMVERGEVADMPAVFAAVERLHLEGDGYVKEAATLGLLEALQNLNLHENGTKPKQFLPYLGPASARWWDKLNRFWEHGDLLGDD